MKYDKIDSSLYIQNRKNFTSHLKKGGLAIFNSNDIFSTSADSTLPFVQHRDIFHLSGVDQEESILLIFPDCSNKEHREILFLKETNELIGDLVEEDDICLVAKGGKAGKGNTRFKSSRNRAPRQSSPGTLGEYRTLYLELSLLADVGLLGYPNAGKSTFIRSISAAKPKVADYPFTTLHPNLGMVRIDYEKSFVVADIPGIIEGASDGIGLGIAFLKHLRRTRILLHIIDLAEFTEETKIIDNIRSIEAELLAFDEKLFNKEIVITRGLFFGFSEK